RCLAVPESALRDCQRKAARYPKARPEFLRLFLCELNRAWVVWYWVRQTGDSNWRLQWLQQTKRCVLLIAYLMACLLGARPPQQCAGILAAVTSVAWAQVLHVRSRPRVKHRSFPTAYQSVR